VSPDNVMLNKSVPRNAPMRLKNKMLARFAPSSIQQVQPVQRSLYFFLTLRYHYMKASSVGRRASSAYYSLKTGHVIKINE